MVALTKKETQLTFSVSQLRAWIQCPRKYFFRYVEGAKAESIPVALAFGIAFHASLQRYYEVIAATGAEPDREHLVKKFKIAWDDAAGGDIPLQGDGEDVEVDDDEIIDKARVMLQAFLDSTASAPLPKVEAAEMPFTVDLHDPATGELLEEKLVGVIDLMAVIDGQRYVVEHKTAGKKWALDQIRFDSQVTAYQYAARMVGLGDVGLRLQVVTKTKKPTVQIEDVRRDDLDEREFLETVVSVLKAIDAGVDHPVRSWACKSCPYALQCAARSSR